MSINIEHRPLAAIVSDIERRGYRVEISRDPAGLLVMQATNGGTTCTVRVKPAAPFGGYRAPIDVHAAEELAQTIDWCEQTGVAT